jgi:hypothetical protein
MIFFLETQFTLPSSWQVTDASRIKGFILTALPVQDNAFELIITSKFLT